MYPIYNESPKTKIREINEVNKYFTWDLIAVDTSEILLNGPGRKVLKGMLGNSDHVCGLHTSIEA